MKQLARLALPLAVGVAVTGCQPAPLPPSPSPSPASAPATASTSANAADVMFTQMMIPHHAQAVTMSDLILAKKGISPEVTRLATQVKNAQQPERDQMRGWLKAWGAPEQSDHSGHMGVDGMLSNEQLDALKSATGTGAEQLYLTGMIEHHRGAIAMAKQVEANGSDPEVKKLAKAIITSQRAEIDQMKNLVAARG